jgi:hypothetical protein
MQMLNMDSENADTFNQLALTGRYTKAISYIQYKFINFDKQRRLQDTV